MPTVSLCVTEIIFSPTLIRVVTRWSLFLSCACNGFVDKYNNFVHKFETEPRGRWECERTAARRSVQYSPVGKGCCNISSQHRRSVALFLLVVARSSLAAMMTTTTKWTEIILLPLPVDTFTPLICILIAIMIISRRIFIIHPTLVEHPPDWKGSLLVVGPKWLKISLHLHFPNGAARLTRGRKWICFAPGAASPRSLFTLINSRCW